ncbi:MAG: hypothetical protein GX620_13815 [Chloroflexi bacterium]|nr:hypothetical protein [Chloroflexota bacterium]
MFRYVNILASLALVASVLFTPASVASVRAQEPQDDEVSRLMAEMSTTAKVGQLFMVTFPGAEVTEDALIAELIRDYQIGGVLLLPSNGNIDNEGDTLTQVANLVSQLQQTSWSARQPLTTTVGAEIDIDPFVPLFIAVNHEGNGAPYTGISNGTTPLPSAMAQGATWDTNSARAVGETTGRELSTLGINMLIGPSLDVLETPRPESTGDLGVRTYGGEPFWVGEMGKAYIEGVHTGADGEVAVIAKHFPGLGASDRSLDEEVPTVQRTLEELRQVDLAPFFAAAQAADVLMHPDGVLVSHIRLRGLEGGRFVTTRPISVDSQVLQRLLALPELVPWREQGGITVSDSLGVRALRRFYDPSGESFNHRRIAQEAFLAGNDVLLLSQFRQRDDWQTQVDAVKSTIQFFQEKYDSEPAFQALVDAAVARILKLKLRLYDDQFDQAASTPNVATLHDEIGGQNESLSAVIRQGITLLSPPSPDLLPAPPVAEDRIVIFTDDAQITPCATCESVPIIPPQALQETISRFYGPNTTGQIDPRRITSFTFTQLEDFLNSPPPAPTPTPSVDESEVSTPVGVSPVRQALQDADWIIFAMLNPSANRPQSNVVRRFLSEEADELRHPNLVVLAYGAPYYLDATEVSKLNVYLVTYTHITRAIETSVRVLFGETTPVGKPPVDVTGISYNLLARTSADPNQIISVYTGAPTPEGEPTPEAPVVKVGDELKLRTSVIVDRNSHQVPDGTPVQFILTYPQEGLERSVTAVTQAGIAEASVILERTGQLNIFIQSDAYPRTLVLQVTIQEGEAATIMPITPTPRPTEPVPTRTPTRVVAPITLTPLQTTPTPDSGRNNESVQGNIGVLDLLIAVVTILVVSGVAYYVARLEGEPTSVALRFALWSTIGGLAVYLVYGINPPGARWLHEHIGRWAAGWVALVGSAVSLALVWLLGRRRTA